MAEDSFQKRRKATMKHKTLCLLCILSICVLFNGCGKDKIQYKDTYVPGQDFQYMYYGETYEFGLSMAETDDAYYKLLDDYIYYVDKKTMKAVPLCGKSDCMHEKESSSHRTNCNAYIRAEDGYMNLYKDNLYVRTTEYDKEEQIYYSVFYSISLDGSKRNKVCEIKKDTIGFWMIHRGKLYYTVTDKNEQVSLKAIDLKKKASPKTVYCAKDIFNSDPGDLVAYGNNIYLFIGGYSKKLDFLNDDNDEDDNVSPKKWKQQKQEMWQNYENKWICYNITNQKVTELFSKQKDKDGVTRFLVQRIAFWQNKLYFTYSDLLKKKDDAIYESNLDGSDEKKWKDIDKEAIFTTDTNYLYVYDSWSEAVEKGKNTPTMWIYDKNKKLVDTCKLPVNFCASIPPGSKQYFWLKAVGDTEDALVYMDKSKIGSLKGKMLKLDTCYNIVRPTYDEITEEE